MARNEHGEYNLEPQLYKGITVRLINRVYKKGFKEMKAKRYLIIPPAGVEAGEINQNVWIPNSHCLPDGTIKEGEDIDYVFRKANRQLELAGYLGPIPGIKRRNVTM